MDLIEKAILKLGGEPEGRSKLPPGETVRPELTAANAVNGVEARQPIPLPPLEVKRRVELDLERFQRAGMVVPDGSRSRVKEEYRHIKQPVLLTASGKGATPNEWGNLVMVTSSVPGEGKTFTATNLAMSIASERDRTVLLVDADVLRANLSSFFNVHNSSGLVDYLTGDVSSLSDVLVGTDIPSLTLLPAGNTHHLSTELLSSGQMRDLVLELSRRDPGCIVIFDSPPLLHTSEARVLAQLMGQILVVVEAERTPRGQVHEAFDIMKNIHEHTSVSLVLNKARKAREWSYYYSYGYGYY